MTNSNLERITISPEICHGKPSIRNTRMMVESILEYLAGGDSEETILKEFPYLEHKDIMASLEYAALSIKTKTIQIAA